MYIYKSRHSSFDMVEELKPQNPPLFYAKYSIDAAYPSSLAELSALSAAESLVRDLPEPETFYQGLLGTDIRQRQQIQRL